MINVGCWEKGCVVSFGFIPGLQFSSTQRMVVVWVCVWIWQ